jgi:hypothetical protein
MALIRVLAFGVLLAAAVEAHAASFCRSLTRQSSGEVTDRFDLELTGSHRHRVVPAMTGVA